MLTKRARRRRKHGGRMPQGQGAGVSLTQGREQMTRRQAGQRNWLIGRQEATGNP
ncbi:MAG: hypothetical protein R2795_06555 [Saprospiraceae bacterium]